MSHSRSRRCLKPWSDVQYQPTRRAGKPGCLRDKLHIYGASTLRLRMDESCPCSTLGVMTRLAIIMDLGTTVIDRFKKAVHTTERKIVSHYLPPVLILIEHEAVSTAEKKNVEYPPIKYGTSGTVAGAHWQQSKTYYGFPPISTGIHVYDLSTIHRTISWPVNFLFHSSIANNHACLMSRGIMNLCLRCPF